MSRPSRLVTPLMQSGAVYSTINRIATQVANIPFKIVRAKKASRAATRNKMLDTYYSGLGEPSNPELKKYLTSGDFEEIEDHWLIDLLYKPNDMMVQFNFMLNTITRLLHDGSVFWAKNYSRGNKIREIWIRPADEFQPEIKDGRLVGWTSNGQTYTKRRLSRLFLLLHPESEVNALSPLQAIYSELQQSFWAGIYNEKFFENGGTIGEIFSTDAELSKEHRDELTSALQARHQGPEKAHKMLLLDGGLKPVGNKSHKDMEFLEQQKWVVEMVQMVFGVPSSVMGGSGAAAKQRDFYESKIAFFEICVIPLLRYLSEQIYCDFLADSDVKGDKECLIVYDLARVDGLRGSTVELSEAAKNLLASGFSRNEVNKRFDMGFEDTSWGDQALVNGAMRSCEKLVEAEVTPGDNTPGAIEDEHNGNPNGNTIAASLGGLVDQFLEKALEDSTDGMQVLLDDYFVDLSQDYEGLKCSIPGRIYSVHQHIKTFQVGVEASRSVLREVVEAEVYQFYNLSKVSHTKVWSGRCSLHKGLNTPGEPENVKNRGCRCLKI